MPRPPNASFIPGGFNAYGMNRPTGPRPRSRPNVVPSPYSGVIGNGGVYFGTDSIVNARPPGPPQSPQNVVPSGYPDPTFGDSLGGASLADRPPFGLLNPPGPPQPPPGPPQLGGGGAQPPNPPPGPPQPPSGGYGGGDFWDANNPYGYAGGVQYNPLAGGPGGSVPPGPPQPPQASWFGGLGQAATTLGSALLGAAGPQMRMAGNGRTLQPGLTNWMAQ